MKFCQNCKGLLELKAEKLQCMSCNQIAEGTLTTSEKINKEGKEGVAIISEINDAATYRSICKKCGYEKAEVIIRDPMISDEDSITMLKCGKCGKVKNLTRKMT